MRPAHVEHVAGVVEEDPAGVDHRDAAVRLVDEVERLAGHAPGSILRDERRAIVLSQFLEPDYAPRLLGAGVDRVGYLLKDRLGEAAELLDAANRVAAGGSAVDAAVIQELVKARRRDDRLTWLTDREREALSLIAEGHSNRAIAERLGITTKTLEGMSGTIFGKLGLEDDPDINRRVLAVLLYLDGAGG